MNKTLLLPVLLIGALSGLSAAPVTGDSLNVGASGSNSVSSSNSAAIGASNTASAAKVLLIGTSNTTYTGSNSALIGTSNYSVSGAPNSVVVGVSNYYSGQLSTSMMLGSYNGAVNSSSVSTDSLIVGNTNTAQTTAGLVVGKNNYVNGAHYVIGRGLIADQAGTMVALGTYNTQPVAGQALVVGVGTSSATADRKNAMEIFQNGDVNLRGGKLSVFAASATPTIVFDPTIPQITINGIPVLTTASNGGSWPGGGAFNVSSNGQAGVATNFGQSMFVGRQLGSTYSHPTGIFQAVTDNANGSANYYFQGITGGPSGVSNFSVRADGAGYFANSIGIGTSAPASRLQVAGGGATIGANAITNNTDGALSIGNASIDYTPNGTNWTTSGSALILTGLDHSDIAFHDSGNRVDFIRVGNGTMQLGYNGAWGEPNIGLPGNGIWTSAGNVGIGTTNPQSRLQVKGLANWDSTTGVDIINGSADYGRTTLRLTGRLQDGNEGWAPAGGARNAIVFATNAAASGQNVGAPGVDKFAIQYNMAEDKIGFVGADGSQKLAIGQDGTIKIPKRQGDVGMGRFTSVVADQ